MALLVVGVSLFLGIHLLPSAEGLRQRIVERMGRNRYRGLFSLVSLAGFVLIIIGKGQAPTVPLWTPPSWGFRASVIGMPIAFVLLASAYAPTNLRRWIRHPMLTAVALWAGLHLLCNGDLASLILFGGFLAYAVFDIVSANLRGKFQRGQPLPWFMDLVPVAIGVGLYFLTLHYHQNLFGRSVLPYWHSLWS